MGLGLGLGLGLSLVCASMPRATPASSVATAVFEVKRPSRTWLGFGSEAQVRCLWLGLGLGLGLG